MSLLNELKRRKVFRVAVVYAATAFAVLQAAEIMAPRMGLPDWVMNLMVLLTVLGFPIAMVLAWALELRPDGSVGRTEDSADPSEAAPAALGKRTLIAAGLLIAAGVGLSAGWLLKPGPASVAEERVITESERQSITVLPFDSLSDDPEQGYFADGLTEEILNSLAVMPKLLVTARTSSFYYKDKDVPVDEIAERLGVSHILEGSVRQSGDQLRVTAQLVRAEDGFHVWSNTYDRPLGDVFAIQTEIAAQVASALGILLDERRRAQMEAAGVRDPGAYALFARGYELYQLSHAGAVQIPTLIEANRFFDQAFERAPQLWAARYHSADLYIHILLEIAAGRDIDTFPSDHAERAQSEYDRRMREARRAAPDQIAQDLVEITRLLASDDWTGLADLARRAYGQDDACGFYQWMNVIGNPFGMAERAGDFFLRGTRCNALDETLWINAASSALYAGDPEHALEIIELGLVTADITGYGLEVLRMATLLALGRFDAARAAIPRLDGSDNFTRMLGGVSYAAATGDEQALGEILREIDLSTSENANVTYLPLLARIGDRVRANALAAAIDARPTGPLRLMIDISACMCGAPFDLEFTPNLAARLQEAGLPWPPADPIGWPLKEW